jgi:hypothetical protein
MIVNRCEHGNELADPSRPFPTVQTPACFLCWKANRPAQVSSVPIPFPVRSLPCIREEEIRSWCPLGDESLHTRGCAIHDSCTRRLCATCSDYDSGRKALEFHIDAGGIGDAVVGLYAACGLADAGYQAVYRCRHPAWFAGVAHPGLTILGFAATPVNGSGDYGRHLQLAGSREVASRPQWYCDRIAEGHGIPTFAPSRPGTVARPSPVVDPGYVVLSPFSTEPARTWPSERWRQLAAEFAGAGKRVVGIDGPGENDARLRDIFGGVSANWYWGMSPGWMLGLLAHAELFVGNDSGMAHIAGLLGTPARAVMTHLRPSMVFDCAPSVVGVGAEGWECQGCAWHYANGFRDECNQGCKALQSIGTDRIHRSLSA